MPIPVVSRLVPSFFTLISKASCLCDLNELLDVHVYVPNISAYQRPELLGAELSDLVVSRPCLHLDATTAVSRRYKGIHHLKGTFYAVSFNTHL